MESGRPLVLLGLLLSLSGCKPDAPGLERKVRELRQEGNSRKALELLTKNHDLPNAKILEADVLMGSGEVLGALGAYAAHLSQGGEPSPALLEQAMRQLDEKGPPIDAQAVADHAMSAVGPSLSRESVVSVVSMFAEGRVERNLSQRIVALGRTRLPQAEKLLDTLEQRSPDQARAFAEARVIYGSPQALKVVESRDVSFPLLEGIAEARWISGSPERREALKAVLGRLRERASDDARRQRIDAALAHLGDTQARASVLQAIAEGRSGEYGPWLSRREPDVALAECLSELKAKPANLAKADQAAADACLFKRAAQQLKDPPACEDVTWLAGIHTPSLALKERAQKALKSDDPATRNAYGMLSMAWGLPVDAKSLPDFDTQASSGMGSCEVTAWAVLASSSRADALALVRKALQRGFFMTDSIVSAMVAEPNEPGLAMIVDSFSLRRLGSSGIAVQLEAFVEHLYEQGKDDQAVAVLLALAKAEDWPTRRMALAWLASEAKRPEVHQAAQASLAEDDVQTRMLSAVVLWAATAPTPSPAKPTP